MTVFTEYGAGWIIAGAVLAFLFVVGLRILKVWESNQSDKIEQNRQLIQITGQMVEQMDRSTTVSEKVAHQMDVINNTNAQMVDALTRSQERSQQMANHTATILDRVNFLYERTIKGE